jgi:hypothetical protein
MIAGEREILALPGIDIMAAPVKRIDDQVMAIRMFVGQAMRRRTDQRRASARAGSWIT